MEVNWGVTETHWESLGFNGGSLGLIGGHWSSLGGHWGSVGVSGAQCSMHIHPRLIFPSDKQIEPIY